MFLDRSFDDQSYGDGPKYVNRLITLRRLVDGWYFQNTRQMKVTNSWPSIPRFFRVICSMTNLEKLELMHLKMTLTEEDLALLFQ